MWLENGFHCLMAAAIAEVAQFLLAPKVRLYENSNRQLSSLYPEHRADIGKSRRVDDETILALGRLKRQKPSVPVSLLLQKMKGNP